MVKLSLEDFVFETLKAISLGVMRAQKLSQQENGIPIALSGVGGKETKQGEQLVRFSVSVEVSEGHNFAGHADARAGIVSVLSGQVGTEAGKSNTDRSANVVEFSVPMHFNATWRKEGDKAC